MSNLRGTLDSIVFIRCARDDCLLRQSVSGVILISY